MNRRDFLWCGSALLASRALARKGPIEAVSAYESASGGHIGLHAENIRTGATLSWRADQRFVMCSTFKASLAACVLSRVDRNEEDLERSVPFSAADILDFYAPVAKANLDKGALSVRELCKGAVEQSDNTCANLLLTRIGGPSAMTAFWRSMGDRETRLDAFEPELNRTPPGGVQNTTTPAAMAEILRHLILGSVLSNSSRTLLTGWMVGCQTGNNRLREGLPAQLGDRGQDRQ